MTLKELGVRCFQQRPGNSAGPEVDVPAPLGADRVLDRDVGELNPTARCEHPEDHREDGVLVGTEVDHPLTEREPTQLPRVRDPANEPTAVSGTFASSSG